MLVCTFNIKMGNVEDDHLYLLSAPLITQQLILSGEELLALQQARRARIVKAVA